MYIKLIILFSIVSSSLLASEINILWWNIGFNNYSQQIDSEQTLLDRTLSTHNFNQYDIIALGEFKENTLNPNSLNNIKENFKYQRVIRYNKAYDKSLYIFSKYPFHLNEKVIDWVSPSWSEKEKSRYKRHAPTFYGSTKTFKRKYVRILIQKNDKKINFIPYHFNNPWSGMKEKFGKYLTASEIVWGTSNPLINQIKSFKKRLTDDFGYNYGGQRIIIMGDSNCPNKVKGFKSSCFREIEETLGVVAKDKNKKTYPADRSTMVGKSPDVKIDHAQSTNHFYSIESKVLDLLGSDHYPIQFKARFN